MLPHRGQGLRNAPLSIGLGLSKDRPAPMVADGLAALQWLTSGLVCLACWDVSRSERLAPCTAHLLAIAAACVNLQATLVRRCLAFVAPLRPVPFHRTGAR